METFENELAAIQASLFQDSATATPPTASSAVAISRKVGKRIMRRAKSEAVLSEILPATPEMGTSYHVISHGDVDSMSYLAYLVRAWPLDHVLISTWVMAMQDVERLEFWLRDGRIGAMTLCVGEIFPAQYPDEFWKLSQLSREGLLSLKVAKNHSKVMIGAAEEASIWFVVESSANMNTNPRIEQTAIHMDCGLHDFYLEFYDGIRSIDAATRPSI